MSLYPEDFWSCPDCNGHAYDGSHRFWTAAPHSIAYIDRCTHQGFREEQFTETYKMAQNEISRLKTAANAVEKTLRKSK